MHDTPYDLAVVGRYYEEISQLIEGIIHEEGRAVVLTCKVFKEYKDRNDREAFKDEEARKCWLYLKARNLANDRLKEIQRSTRK